MLAPLIEHRTMKKHILFFVFTLLPLYSSLAQVTAKRLQSEAAQESLLVRNYEFVRSSDPWLTQGNAAALTRFSAPNIAEAELSLSRQGGGLVNYDGSPSVLQFDASAEAFYRLSRRTVVFGSIAYDNFSGNDMSGSVFMPSSLNARLSSLRPFDIVEENTDNEGRKHSDIYRLSGGVGVDVWRGYALGARLDYTAANYAKYKDLRHKNKLMDLAFSVGAYAPVLSWLNLGANYTYHRNTESVNFSTYGKSEKVYKSLINYGAFFGTLEQFGNEGYTDKSREMPLFEDGHHGNIQLELRPMHQLSVLATFGFGKGKGYYGRQSPYTITYTQHERRTKEATLSLLYRPLSGLSSHRLDFSYRNEKLANRAETFREMKNKSGASYYVYYDPVETADKQLQNISVVYTASLGVRGETPTWNLQVAWQWFQREQLNYLFPFYRHQKLSAYECALGVSRNFFFRRGILSCSLKGALCKGTGAPYDDGTFVTPSEKQEQPATADVFLYREYQYLTAPQYAVGGSAKYAFVFPGTRLKTHVRFDLSHCKANGTLLYSRGCDRTQGTIAVGCTF